MVNNFETEAILNTLSRVIASPASRFAYPCPYVIDRLPFRMQTDNPVGPFFS